MFVNPLFNQITVTVHIDVKVLSSSRILLIEQISVRIFKKQHVDGIHYIIIPLYLCIIVSQLY